MAIGHRFYAIAASLVLLLALVPRAEAERAINCQDFREALWRAIDDDGNKVARPHLDKATSWFGPTISYEMTEIVGLEGRLICSNDHVLT